MQILEDICKGSWDKDELWIGHVDMRCMAMILKGLALGVENVHCLSAGNGHAYVHLTNLRKKENKLSLVRIPYNLT